MVSIEKIRNFFTADRYAVFTGIQIDQVEEGFAVCSLIISEKHLNAGDTVQGGVIFTLADFAFAVASNSYGKLTLSLNNNISYLHATRGDTLFATAKKISSSKKVCNYEVEVTDNLGVTIAKMTATGFIKDQEISI